MRSELFFDAHRRASADVAEQGRVEQSAHTLRCFVGPISATHTTHSQNHYSLFTTDSRTFVDVRKILEAASEKKQC